jgi:hypothetical protein
MADYITNSDFSAALAEYRLKCFSCDEAGIERPTIPKYIAQAFVLLCNKMSNRPNFNGYSYKDEMVSEGIIACCNKVTNYDPAVSPNAFGYYSRVAWFAFLAVITKEHKEAYIKAKAFFMAPDELFAHHESAEDSNEGVLPDFVPFFNVADYEKKDQEKRDRMKASSIQRKKEEVGILSELFDDNPVNDIEIIGEAEINV